MKNSFYFLAGSLLLLFSCVTVPDRTSTDVVRRTIEQGDTLQYSLGLFKETEEAEIAEQARNAAISTLDRNTSTAEINYFYVPLPNFSGEDFVEIHSLLQDNAQPQSSRTIITEMTIIVNE